MPTTQKSASIVRTVAFRTRGTQYVGFLHTTHGSVIQEYDEDGAVYPQFTPTSPERVTFVATSSATQGVVVPDSIKYKVGGVELTFDASGACTTSGCSQYFRKDGADLLIIGDIAIYLDYACSTLEAIAKKGDDDIYASCPIEISKQIGGPGAKVSIAPGDNKSFTLTSQTDSILLKCGVLKQTGWIYNSPDYKYHWEIADASETSGWRILSLTAGPAGGTIVLDADDVNTYANIRCTVYRKNTQISDILGQSLFSVMPVGTDCVGVQDASDPLDIILDIKVNKTGTGTEVEADELALDDSMPANAYLLLTPTLVVRGQTASAGNTTWLPGQLVDPAGVTTRNVVPVSGKYKLLVSDFGGIRGEHTIVLHGELS